jgi:hypothetical protein
MGTFDTRNDTPLLLNKEALDITLKFDRTGPTTGRISWNIPTPATGCDSTTQAYCGMVLTLDTVAAVAGSAPLDGQTYTGDPTGDVNLHAGDKLGSALVVGAFYNDRITTFIDIGGLQPSSVYYVAGYPHDCVNRYYTVGVYAYSLDYTTNPILPDTNGYDIVKIGDGTGVQGTDSTGLIPSTIYQFKIIMDGTTENVPNDPFDLNSFTTKTIGTEYTVSINGSDALTYNDLVVALNHELQKLQNPPVSPTAPNTGSYYWDNVNKKLYQWNGSENIPLVVTTESIQPNTPSVGNYWYEPTSNILKQWNGVSWVTQNVIQYSHDPRTPTCNDYWFTGTLVYLWNGTTWCTQTVFNQGTDPSLAVEPPCGTYWYNENTQHLYNWNVNTKLWDAINAIAWNVDPTTPVSGTYWFDSTTNKLFQFNIPTLGVWNDISVVTIVSTIQPTAPALNSYWFNPTTEELKQCVVTTPITYTDLNVLVWDTDPMVGMSCQLWWNTTNDTLHVWDSTTSSWDLVSNFILSITDPAMAPTLSVGSMWYNPSTQLLSRWDGVSWISVSFVAYPTDPTLPAINDTWHNPTDTTWSVWNGASWVSIDPIEAVLDPTVPLIGSYWFNTLTNSLNQWNGSSWITLLYSTMPPAPATGTVWYDLTNNVLKEWNGTSWQPAVPLARADLNASGNLLFTSNTTGHTSTIFLTDISLFAALPKDTALLESVYGADGIKGQPSYMLQGVGTDGTPDQRLHMVDELRTLLGHPTIQVELSNYQLDFCITNALEYLRRESSAAYKQGYFFLYTVPGKQSYILTNRGLSFDKIVSIMGVYRMVSAFLSTVQGAGAYGQIVLQHLYNMGTFDILSYFMVSQYVEQLEQMFAARLTFNWDEQTRTLTFPHTFARTEILSIDATVERTEQELLTDRWTKNWIQDFALANARMMLAEIRGKFSTLPGAGGGVSLNAADLRALAEAGFTQCQQELDDFVVSDIEKYGIGTTFVIG